MVVVLEKLDSDVVLVLEEVLVVVEVLDPTGTPHPQGVKGGYGLFCLF
jgi:hypothetical protein